MSAAVRPLDVMIVGGQKCGSTALQHYLGLHPHILTHQQHEFTYFVDPGMYQDGYETVFRRYFRAQDLQEETVLLAKSATSMYSPAAVDRMREHSSSLKAICILRDPTKRAYSLYWYARARGIETAPTFELALERDRAQRPKSRWVIYSYLRAGRYMDHLERMIDALGADRVATVVASDLRYERKATLNGIFKWIGLSRLSEIPEVSANGAQEARFRTIAKLMTADGAARRIGTALVPAHLRDRIRDAVVKRNFRPFSPPPMSRDTEVALRQYFTPSIEKLEAFLARDLSDWKTRDEEV